VLGLSKAIQLAERGLIPDWFCRKGIRSLIALRIKQERSDSDEENRRKAAELLARLRTSSVAVHPDKANEQHYELPSEFFQKILGVNLKYSCCHWSKENLSLDEAEESALELTSQRAELRDGNNILELGCGWGSLSLFMAQKFPSSRILSMSNSALQREFIVSQAAARNLHNLEVVTADINAFDTDREFDRIVSVEMLEHVRNYQRLFSRMARWLKPDGKLFVHIFSHQHFAYTFETEGAANWMGRYFFTGGIMPSHDLLLHFQENLKLEERWRWNGSHYSRTARAWLENMDRQKEAILPIIRRVYGEEETTRWWVRWRLFFMSCEELFGYNKGEEWGVSHYRFVKK